MAGRERTRLVKRDHMAVGKEQEVDKERTVKKNQVRIRQKITVEKRGIEEYLTKIDG